MRFRPPGKVVPGTQPEVVAMLCTAGHVDHGKTSLVKALTGADTDKLRAERERGLTIETSNAQLRLTDDLAAGIADVPGHERFIRNMVGGVTGIDLALLVVAADDGVMPQTVEHLRIMELLGLTRGVVALTKVDQVAPERIKAVADQVASLVADTFLAGAPLLPVSSLTGEGVEALHRVLVERILAADRERPQAVFRLPIHRVFTKAGSGVVVTGCPQHGTVAVGDRVELHPGGTVGRVRALQRFKGAVDSGGQGQCLALSIPEFAKRPPAPGDVICTPGYLESARVFHLELTLCPGVESPLRHGEVLSLHTGRTSRSGRLHLLEGEVVGAGERTLAVLVLDAPLAAAEHDRFVLRRPSPSVTVGGGRILGVDARRVRVRGRRLLLPLRAKAAWFAGVDPHGPEGQERRLLWFLRADAPTGATAGEIGHRALLPPERVASLLAAAVAREEVESLAGGRFIHRECWQACLEALGMRLEAYAAQPGVVSVAAPELRRELGWPDALWRGVVAEVTRQRPGLVRGDRFVLVEEKEGLSEGERELLAALAECYRTTGWRSPRPAQLPDLLRAPADRIEPLLQLLLDRGELVRLHRNVIVDARLCAAARELVVSTIREEGRLDSCSFPRRLGTSRKYGLAFLDHLDRQNVTIRGQHNFRTLRRGYSG